MKKFGKILIVILIIFLIIMTICIAVFIYLTKIGITEWVEQGDDVHELKY